MASADRLIEVFNEAKAQPAGAERDLFLSEACRDEPELKQQVLSLLQAHEGAGDFLKNTLAIPPATVFTEKPGDKIGRYKLLQQIGEGGCGVVYMAEQEEPVRRRVAFKVIKLGMDTKQVVARFEAEGQALALMDHPNIAKVFDAGATDTGRPYFVMELVRGIKITDYCDQNNLPTEERLKLFTQVCHAIQHAHQKGIIHRDIKPSNILVTVNDGVPVPKVIDFGIAKAIEQRLTDKTVFTAFEQFIGTPAYMSPEQAEMTSLDIDTRADIYSLGVLLYELLSGNTPFDAEKLVASGVAEIRRIIREQEPPKPSTRLNTLNDADLGTVAQRRQTDPPKLMQRIRGDLDWIVMKCLEKDRTRRYETANGLATDIQRHLQNEPVVARPPSNLYRFQKLVRRNKVAFAAVSAVIAALVLGLGLSTWMFFKEKAAYERAVAAEQEQGRLRRQAEAEASESRRVATYLGNLAQRLRAERNLTNSESAYRESLAMWKRLPDGENRDVDNSLLGLRGVLLDQSKLAEAEALAREELAMEKKLSGDEHVFVANSLLSLAAVLRDSAKWSEAETLFREALRMRRKLLGNENPAVADSLVWLATVLEEQDKHVEAEPVLREALALRRKLFGNESREVANALFILGRILSYQGKHTESEATQREALALRRKLLGNEHTDVTISLSELADALKWQRKLAEAESLLREELVHVRTADTNAPSQVRPTLGLILHHLADVLRKRGALKEARALAEEASALYDRHPDWLASERDHTLRVLGYVLLDLGDFSGLEALDRKRINDLRTRPAPDYPYLAGVLADSAQHLFAQDKFAEAETMHREALAIRRKALGIAHPNVGLSLSQLTRVLRAEGKLGEAEALLRGELIQARTLDANAPSQASARALYQLADVLHERKALKEARAFAEEAVTLYERHPDWPGPLRYGALQVLSAVLTDLGDSAGLEALNLKTENDLRTRLSDLHARLPGDDPQLAAALAGLTRFLLVHQKFAEAEPTARECLAIRERKRPDDWQTFNARSLLGGSLLGQRKFAEAEPLLLSGYEGMKERKDQIPTSGKILLQQNLQRLVQLYEGTGQSEKAAEWNEKLAEFDQAEAKKKTAVPKP